MNILKGSPAINKGNSGYSTFPDILSNTRVGSSDIGAYNFIQ